MPWVSKSKLTLHHDRHPVFHARAGRLADDDVAGPVHNGFQPQALTELPHERDHSLLFFGRAGNGVQLAEVLPHPAGFEIENFSAHDSVSSNSW
jgi:hypothetical protein